MERRKHHVDAQLHAGGGEPQSEDGPTRWDRTASSEPLSTVSSPSTTPDKETDVSQTAEVARARSGSGGGASGGGGGSRDDGSSTSRMVSRLRRSVDSMATV